MFKCTVEIYGLPQKIITLRKVEVELEEGAGLEEVIAGMRQQIPGMIGPVILKDKDSLMERFVFNVNGRFYFKDGGNLQIKKGDHIALLSVATGG